MNRDFLQDLAAASVMIERKNPLAFTRFSDGELYIMQNKTVVIKDKRVIIGEDYNNPVTFEKEDEKEFLPDKHQDFRQKLVDAYNYTPIGMPYIKGIPCRCCVGEENHKWAIDNAPAGSAFTWSNLFVNSNYPYFIEKVFPLFSRYDIRIVCNTNARIDRFGFRIEKDYRVGNNCIINDQHLVKEMVEDTKNITGRLFLFSASSLSALLIHKLYEANPNNTYLNIGTTLNYFMGMSMERDYLKAYWGGNANYFGSKKCIW